MRAFLVWLWLHLLYWRLNGLAGRRANGADAWRKLGRAARIAEIKEVIRACDAIQRLFTAAEMQAVLDSAPWLEPSFRRVQDLLTALMAPEPAPPAPRPARPPTWSAPGRPRTQSFFPHCPVPRWPPRCAPS